MTKPRRKSWGGEQRGREKERADENDQKQTAEEGREAKTDSAGKDDRTGTHGTRSILWRL